jgi:hypothetical protein
MDEKVKYVTEFFFDEGMPVKVIIARLKDHYGANVVSRSTVSYWLKQVRLGRKELSNTPAPRRDRDDGITDRITDRLAQDPYLLVTKTVQGLDVARSTVEDDLVNDFGMKSYRIQLILQTLTSAEKSERTEMVKGPLVELAKNETFNLHFLFTGDESWVSYVTPSGTMRATSRAEVNQGVRPSHYQSKPRTIVFFNGFGTYAEARVFDIDPDSPFVFGMEIIATSVICSCEKDRRVNIMTGILGGHMSHIWQNV